MENSPQAWLPSQRSQPEKIFALLPDSQGPSVQRAGQCSCSPGPHILGEAQTTQQGDGEKEVNPLANDEST